MSSICISKLSWSNISKSLLELGYGRLGKLLSRAECEYLRSLYTHPEFFRSRIDMERYRFGRGEYQYFNYPLPPLVAELRTTLFPFLVDTANEWMELLSLAGDFPVELERFLDHCHASGQNRSTPLVLRYRRGDYNCLHQDIYGAIVFPFQLIICLSRPGDEFTGGELLLVEQRPRAQSSGQAISLEQGEAIVITTRYRPVRGPRGYYRANIRHGVSPLLGGERYALGVIFHDAA